MFDNIRFLDLADAPDEYPIEDRTVV